MFGIKNKIVSRIEKRIGEYCYHELKKVEVHKKVGLFNYKCFHNAANFASMNKNHEVIMGFYNRNGTDNYCLHFWVRKDEKDYEVSMGYLAECFNYYEIKIIKDSDWDIIDSVFSDALEYYKEKFVKTWFEKLILIGERIL